jgi:hypothetical protein
MSGQYQLAMIATRRDKVERQYNRWQDRSERTSKWLTALRRWKGRKLPYTFGVLDVIGLKACRSSGTTEMSDLSAAPAGAWCGCARNDSAEVASWVMRYLHQASELRTNTAARRSGVILGRRGLFRYRAPWARPWEGHKPSKPISNARDLHGRDMRRASRCRSDGSGISKGYQRL